MSECGFDDIDDDWITSKRKERPELPSVQLPAKRPRSQKQTVVPQPVVPQPVIVPQPVVNHKPIQWFREFDDRIQTASYDNVGWRALKKHYSTVPLPFLPLDDSQEDVTEEDVTSRANCKSTLRVSQTQTV